MSMDDTGAPTGDSGGEPTAAMPAAAAGGADGTGTPDQPDSSGSGRRNALIAVLVVLLLVAAGVIFALVRNNDDNSATSTDGTSTTTANDTTTTTTADTTTTSSDSGSTTTTASGGGSTTVPAGATNAVWPWASSDTRYTDPVDAAKGFAVDFVGFQDPVVGTFNQATPTSGEVDVQPAADGPVTIVSVAQLDGGTWWVIGSTTDHIKLNQPAALETISSPVALDGFGSSDSGVINVEIREDGNDTPIGEGTVKGGDQGTIAEFSGSVTFSSPTADNGAIVLFTLTADKHVAEASVVRVGL